MQLHTQQPYWLMKDGMVGSYSSLSADTVTDVAVIGAGISGALAAYYLRNTGLRVVVLDKGHAGAGSTAASTAFLQYEIDTPLRKLQYAVGLDNAVRSYRLCREAIYTIGRICKSLTPEFDFHTRPSLQYASYRKDVAGLRAEYELRKRWGFDLDWLEAAEVAEKFGIGAPAAILSADGGEVDAYLLTHALLRVTARRGHSIYNNTAVEHIRHSGRSIVLHTDRGYTVKARKLIIACGYESMKYIPRPVARVYSTYALVSEPVPQHALWHGDSLVWETAQPYMYFRKVGGNRVLVGGRDDEFHPHRIVPSVVKKKALQLEQSFNRRMSHVSIRGDFSWGGAFAVTADGLPYIGTLPGGKHTYFALGYGGNGITFSVIAAGIIRDLVLGKKNKDQSIFDFNR